MNGAEILKLQLAGSFDLIADRLRSDEAARLWARLPWEAANPPGFTLWHCSRTIDWAVQCAIRGVDEVACRPKWSARLPSRFRFGAGIPAAAAREVASSSPPELVSKYLQAVREESLAWLDSQTDQSLDVVPDFRVNNENVEGYTAPSVWAEIEDLEGVPAWEILARPSISHIRLHIGEVHAALQVLAQSPPGRAEANGVE